jgi:hypothetical protein
MSRNIPISSPEFFGVSEVAGSRIMAIAEAVSKLKESTQAMGIVVASQQPNTWDYARYASPSVKAASPVNTASTPSEIMLNLSPDRFRPAVDNALELSTKNEAANRAAEAEAELDVLAKYRRNLDEVYDVQEAA